MRNLKMTNFQDEETWQVNDCKTCTCSRGQMHCTIEVCSQSSNVPCPPNMRLHKEPGSCCPKCVEGNCGIRKKLNK